MFNDITFVTRANAAFYTPI